MKEHGSRRQALVVGSGIAGMSTAKRLTEIGWQVTVVERAAKRRSGGYFIAMFGTGTSSAARMGILDRIPTRLAPNARSWTATRDGRRRPGISIADLPDAPRMLLRSDVEAALFETMPDSVEIRFGTSPLTIRQDPDGVDVTLISPNDQTTVGRYDLVIGADGINSTVRRIAFGPDANFVHKTGYMIAATLLEHDPDGFSRGDSLSISEPSRSVTTFAFRDRPPSVLFSYRADNVDSELKRVPIDALRAAFGPEPAGPILTDLLDQYEQSDRPLFDSARQVKMRQWHDGRVALIGDAAWCMTLYSGLGASLSIAGGELLGTMLVKHSHAITPALEEWNARMHPYVHGQHRQIESSRAFFVPADRKEHLQRIVANRALSARPLRLILGKLTGPNKDFAMKAVDIAAI